MHSSDVIDRAFTGDMFGFCGIDSIVRLVSEPINFGRSALMSDSVFWHGIHLPNHAFQLTLQEMSLIKLGRFNAAKALDFVANTTLERVRVRCGIENWVIRLWWDHQPERPCHYVSAKVSWLVEMLEGPLDGCNVVIEIHNEPNHKDRREGWGNDIYDARKFDFWYKAVLALFRRYFDDHNVEAPRFCSPGLANGDAHNDVEWYDEIAESCKRSDLIGVHTYWQGNNHLNPDWGLRYRGVNYHTPLLITEYGDSSFESAMFDANPISRAGRIREWLYHVKEDGVRGAFYFLLGGTDHWVGHRLDEMVARAMGDFALENL